MKIEIAEQNKHKICLYIPLILLKSLKYITFKPCDDIKEPDSKILKECVKFLKNYKKEVGSFVMVEVEEAEGTHVKITI